MDVEAIGVPNIRAGLKEFSDYRFDGLLVLHFNKRGKMSLNQSWMHDILFCG